MSKIQRVRSQKLLGRGGIRSQYIAGAIFLTRIINGSAHIAKWFGTLWYVATVRKRNEI